MKEDRFGFKPAKSKNSSWNLTKTFIQTAMFWLLFLGLIPAGILAFEKMIGLDGFIRMEWIGAALLIVFSLIGIYSGYTMSWIGKGTPLPIDCPNQLVIEGPYKVIRNPMAFAGIGQGVCVGLIFGSYMIIIYALVGAILWHMIVRPVEEKDLEHRFGKRYLDYRKEVKCWIPTFHKMQ